MPLPFPFFQDLRAVLAPPLAALLAAGAIPCAAQRTVPVASGEALRAALSEARAGDRILIGPGVYPGTYRAAGLAGTGKEPVLIAAAEPSDAPVFGGGSAAFHLSACSHVILRDLIVRGCSTNGINLDDAGKKDGSAHHLRLENILVEDIGPRGNNDALKLSGLDHFEVTGCTLRGWGGSGIDMVGCHDGRVSGCLFAGKDGFSQSNAVQIKGGSARVRVSGNTFLHAGQRGINIGGSTGLDYFRPKVTPYEAAEVEVSDNVFIGGMAPVAWVNAEGGRVHHNTIYHPEKWVARILQENTGEGFHPSRNGTFEDNLIVVDERVRVWVNVGGGTAPETFAFRRNAWFASDAGGARTVRRHRPQLPAQETDGVYGIDPELANPGTAAMHPGSKAPELQGKGRRPDPPSEKTPATD